MKKRKYNDTDVQELIRAAQRCANAIAPGEARLARFAIAQVLQRFPATKTTSNRDGQTTTE